MTCKETIFYHPISKHYIEKQNLYHEKLRLEGTMAFNTKSLKKLKTLNTNRNSMK